MVVGKRDGQWRGVAEVQQLAKVFGIPVRQDMKTIDALVGRLRL